MKHPKIIVFNLLVGLFFTTLIWQLSEPKVAELWSKLCFSVTGHSFQEVQLQDAQGVPMRYLPGVGKVYEPQLIASEAVRFYQTRIDPDRLNAFLNLSNWLIEHRDSTGLVPQPYSFPRAKQKQPWYGASTQAGAMLAIAERSGHLHDPVIFQKARFLLHSLKPGQHGLSSALPDGGLWFWDYGKDAYSLNGMFNTLICLGKYSKMVGDSTATDLFARGVKAVQNQLPELEHKGWLEDKYLGLNPRSEHLELLTLLSKVNEVTPDSVFTPVIQKYQQRNYQFILLQLIQRPRIGRISGFLLMWLVLSLIAYAFLHPRQHREFTPELTDSE